MTTVVEPREKSIARIVRLFDGGCRCLVAGGADGAQTQTRKVRTAKAGVLAPAKRLGGVRRAWTTLGYNRAEPSIEAAVVERAMEPPAQGGLDVAITRWQPRRP